MNHWLRIVALGLGLSVVAALLLFVTPRPYPSDQALRARFFAHRADFERLLAMVNEDSRLTRIAPDFTWLDDNVAWARKDVGISESRWNEYRRLLRKLVPRKVFSRASILLESSSRLLCRISSDRLLKRFGIQPSGCRALGTALRAKNEMVTGSFGAFILSRLRSGPLSATGPPAARSP